MSCSTQYLNQEALLQDLSKSLHEFVKTLRQNQDIRENEISLTLTCYELQMMLCVIKERYVRKDEGLSISIEDMDVNLKCAVRSWIDKIKHLL